MILKIAVCDDNDKDIEIINRELLLLEEKAREKGCTYQIQAFKSGNDILKSFALVQDMHILFLDIDMPGIDGMEIAKRLEQTERRVKVIFVTNHADMVFTAIHYRPFRFIRKERLHIELEEALLCAIEEIREESLYGEIFIEKDEAEIRISDITYLESQRHYVIVHFRRKDDQVIRAKISDFSERLERYGFVRTHVGYIVNIRDIYSINTKRVLLDDRTPIPVSRAMRQISANLDLARRQQRIPVALLAERAGLSMPTVTKMLRTGNGSFENFLRIARLLGLLDGVQQATDPLNTDIGKLRADEDTPKRIR